MNKIYTACAALAVFSMVSISSLAQAGVSKPVNTEWNNDGKICRVAEPGTLLMLGSGLMALGVARRIRKNG